MSRQANGGPFTCGALTSPARMYVDPAPEDYCDTDVENEGDLCERHDYTDEDAADDAREHDIESRMGN